LLNFNRKPKNADEIQMSGCEPTEINDHDVGRRPDIPLPTANIAPIKWKQRNFVSKFNPTETKPFSNFVQFKSFIMN